VATHFRSLVAYQLADAISHDLHAAVMTWPSFDRWSTGIQLMRAIDSVGANIAEASGRWSRPDQVRHLAIARGSLRETEHWVHVASTRRLLAHDQWEGRVMEASRVLSGLIRKWGSTA
jgi:four helix bundle protein